MKFLGVQNDCGAEDGDREECCLEGGCQLFLHEHGLEVSRIYAGVIASPLFRIDIPSSSKSIGVGTESSETEMDDEVELAEELGPLDLLAGE